METRGGTPLWRRVGNVMASGAWPQVRGARGFRVPWTLPTQQFVTRYRTLGVVTVEEMLGKVTGLQVLPGPPRCSPLLLGEPGPGGSFRVSAPKVGWITLGSSGPCGPARRGPLQSPLPPSPVAVVCVRECACGGGGAEDTSAVLFTPKAYGARD